MDRPVVQVLSASGTLILARCAFDHRGMRATVDLRLEPTDGVPWPSDGVETLKVLDHVLTEVTEELHGRLDSRH